jgi:hypothetical protein
MVLRPAMTISDRNRKYFEGIGLSAAIRRELIIGGSAFLGLENDQRRIEAREWIDEQEQNIRDKERTHNNRELWTLISAIVAAVAGVIGVAWINALIASPIRPLSPSLGSGHSFHRTITYPLL